MRHDGSVAGVWIMGAMLWVQELHATRASWCENRVSFTYFHLAGAGVLLAPWWKHIDYGDLSDFTFPVFQRDDLINIWYFLMLFLSLIHLDPLRVESVVSERTSEELSNLRSSPTSAPRSSPTEHHAEGDDSHLIGGHSDMLNHSDALKRLVVLSINWVYKSRS